MTLRHLLRQVLTSPAERELDVRLESRFQRGVIPNDMGLRMHFPPKIKSNEEKVIYTLSKEGRVSYANLLLLTALSKKDIDIALKKLSDRKIVSQEIKTIHEKSSDEAIETYSLYAYF